MACAAAALCQVIGAPAELACRSRISQGGSTTAPPRRCHTRRRHDARAGSTPGPSPARDGIEAAHGCSRPPSPRAGTRAAPPAYTVDGASPPPRAPRLDGRAGIERYWKDAVDAGFREHRAPGRRGHRCCPRRSRWAVGRSARPAPTAPTAAGKYLVEPGTWRTSIVICGTTIRSCGEGGSRSPASYRSHSATQRWWADTGCLIRVYLRRTAFSSRTSHPCPWGSVSWVVEQRLRCIDLHTSLSPSPIGGGHDSWHGTSSTGRRRAFG